MLKEDLDKSIQEEMEANDTHSLATDILGQINAGIVKN